MAQFPWVSKTKELAIKKINTGIRCHLVSRPANTPPGMVPVPQCTNPTNHLLRFAGIGRQDTAFFLCRPLCGICFAWLHAACRLSPSMCDCREIAFYWGEKHKTTMQSFDSRGALTEGVCFKNLETKWPLAYVLYECQSHRCWGDDLSQHVYVRAGWLPKVIKTLSDMCLKYSEHAAGEIFQP